MKFKQLVSVLVCLVTCCVAIGDALDDAFRNPPDSMRPMCYWYWLNGDVTKDGISKDLEAMAKAGIQVAMIGNVANDAWDKLLPKGSVKMFSPEWYELTHHAFREADRLSVELMLFNGPGWSQSGGPWIAPEQSMRRVSWNEFEVSGGKFSKQVRDTDSNPSQDIAVLAIPRISGVTIEKPCKVGTIEFSHSSTFVARSMAFTPVEDNYTLIGNLFAVQADGSRKLVREIDETIKGRNAGTSFLPLAPEFYSLEEIPAQSYVLEMSQMVGIGKVVLSSLPIVEQAIEKQMGRMHPTPSPTWESYLFADTTEPGDSEFIVSQNSILNLTDKLNEKGYLSCTLPKGDWTVLYFGMVTTGVTNGPAPAEATGLECDKMSREHTEHHFNSMFGKLMNEMSVEERSAFRGITIDSYEVGSQNWTDGFADEFASRNGYDPIALLPVMTGRVVGSAKISDQFLWDLRRSVADMIAENYVGGLRDIAHENDLTLWCENYGHWGFAGDFTVYGAYTDEIGGEFWTNNPNDLGTIECRAASSSGHMYGKQRVYAEAYTSRNDYNHHPYLIKARGEEMFCEGINHFVLHVYAQQPKDGVPGRNPPFGTAFNRNTPWFNESRDWVTYLQRMHYMLQQGEPSADVAVYIGDFAPQMTGPADPVPEGYDFDYIGSDAILRKLEVVDGEWVVYDEHDPDRIAARWKVLVVPESGYTRPEVQARLAELISRGGRVVHSVPVLESPLQDLGVDPIVSDLSCSIRWKARRLEDGMSYLLSNFEKTGTFEATFRVQGKVPELFNPVTGEIRQLVRYENTDEGVRIRINVLDNSDSFFVLFREDQKQPSVISSNRSPAELDLYRDRSGHIVAETTMPGLLEVELSDGSKRSISITGDSQSIPIGGKWDTAIRDRDGFSVLKETNFELQNRFGSDERIILDLGSVRVMAKVTLNNHTYDTLWMPPYELDVTEAIRKGKNSLKVIVTSTSEEKPSLGEKVQLKTKLRQRL